MVADNNKITIKFKDKEYEIKKSEKEQKIKSKGAKATNKEITVKNYKEGKWNHTCECSEDGSKFEEVAVKWGGGRHAITWGGGGIFTILIGWASYWFFSKKSEGETSE